MATFHVFPDLPMELRLLIWEHSMQPRVVDLSWGGRQGNCFVDDSGGHPPSSRHAMLFSHTPPPAILCICREAHSVGEMHYQKTSMCPHARSRLGQLCKYYWLNFDTDTIQIGVRCIPDLDHPPHFPALHLIQKLQIFSVHLDMDYFSSYSPRFKHFGALKSVEFIHDGSLRNWYTGIADPEDEYLWGCDPKIVRIIEKDTGEVLDYDMDKKLVDFDEEANYCSDSCVHIGPHDWDWAIDDGGWYRRLFGDI